MHRLGARVGADARERRRVDGLQTHEMKRAWLPAKSPDDAGLVGDDAVVLRVAIDDGHGDDGIGVHVLCGQRGDVNIGERVTVDDQEAIRFQHGQGTGRTTG